MGLALCDKHGTTGVVPSISLDVCKAVQAQTKLSPNQIRIVKIEVYDENEFLLEDKTYVSEAQFIQCGLTQKYVIRSDEDEEKLNSVLPKTSGLCAECFKDYLKIFQVALA